MLPYTVWSMIFYESMINPGSVTPLKKTKFPSSNSYQLPVASRLDAWLYPLDPSMLRVFVDWTFPYTQSVFLPKFHDNKIILSIKTVASRIQTGVENMLGTWTSCFQFLILFALYPFAVSVFTLNLFMEKWLSCLCSCSLPML